MKKKVKCWEFFECNEKACPAYMSKELWCWLIPETHCRDEIQGKFLEKIEMCLECELLKANLDLASVEETLKATTEQFTEFRGVVQERDSELERTSMELALGLSEVFEALKEISSGDPEVRIPEASDIELIAKLKHMVNLTAQNIAEIVNLSHEFAIGLAEHFNVLHRVSKGDLRARVSGTSQVELLEYLKQVTNQMIESVYREITERKRAEEALKQSEKRFEQVAENSEEWIWEVDGNGLYTYASPVVEKILGYKPTEIVGKKHFYDLFHPDEREQLKKAAFEVFAKNEPFREFINRNICKNGDTVWLSTGGVPVVDIEGNLVGYRGADTNITESKRLEAQLQQAQKMEAIGTLAGGIAHDFNNLLTGIQGNVSLVLLDKDDMHPDYERLQNIENQVQGGARLTSHLLGYARKGRYEIKPIAVNQLVEETSRAFGRTKKAITIHRELAEDLFPIEADPGQIEQVLWNLYVNAADAMPRGGDLFLKTMNATRKDMKGKLYKPKPGNYVLLTVTDTGMGMGKKTIERVFDPFFTTKEMGRGTGLGLASSYGIIKAHSGYIDVDSRKGQGSTFNIYLPASEKRIEEAVRRTDEIIRGSETVLFVDDEETIREVSKKLLETMGYRVLMANEGKEAVELYQRNQNDIDIVLLDMVMPNMGGGEAYDRMKEINPNVKVLLSSGFSIDGEASEILERGCDGFIQKPFNMNELSGKIREVSDRK